FDMGVNAGIWRSARLLQRALGFTGEEVDGCIGPETLDAAAKCDPRALVTDLAVRQAAYYRSLADFATFGTGWLNRTKAPRDAVRTAMRALDGRLAPQGSIEDVLVLYGDTPFLATETLSRLLTERRRSAAAVLVSGMRPADPSPYGRFVLAPDGGLDRIVEAADAGPEEQAIGLVNGGITVIEACRLSEFLDELDSDNAKREFYLTDIVGIARRKGLAC